MILPSENLHRLYYFGKVHIHGEVITVEFRILQSRQGELRVYMPYVKEPHAALLADLDWNGPIQGEVLLHDKHSGISFLAEHVSVRTSLYKVNRHGSFYLQPTMLKRVDGDALENANRLFFSVSNIDFTHPFDAGGYNTVETDEYGQLSFSPIASENRYNDIINSMDALGLPQVTGYAEVVRDEAFSISELPALADVMDDYMLLVSFAQGRQIHWLSCLNCNDEVVMLHERRSLRIKDKFNAIMSSFINEFLQKCFHQFQANDKSVTLTTAINWYLSSLSAHFFEDQCIAIFTGLEWLKANYHSEFESDAIVNEPAFDTQLQPELESFLEDIVAGNPDLSTEIRQTPEPLPHDRLQMLKSRLPSLNRYSYKNSLRLLFHQYQVPYGDLFQHPLSFQQFIDLRNALIHEGQRDVLNSTNFDLQRHGRALLIRTILSILEYDRAFRDGVRSDGKSIQDLRAEGLG